MHDNRIEKNVSPRDIIVIPYSNPTDDVGPATTRSNVVTGVTNEDSTATEILTSVTENHNTTRNNLPFMDDVYAAMKACYKWSNYTSDNPLYQLLKSGSSRQKGWLRTVITGSIPTPKSHLSQQENLVLTTISCLFSGYRNKGNTVVPKHSPFTQHAFGISKNTHQNIMIKFTSTEGTLKRKTRSDQGKTIFNSDKKRKAAFTPFNVFRKRRNRMFRETTARLPTSMLKTEFESLPNSEKEAFAIIAQRDFQRSRFLWTELKELLLKCKGKISYATMANQLGDIVSPNTIAKWLKQQKGFSTRKDRVLPSLDKAAMLKGHPSSIS